MGEIPERHRAALGAALDQLVAGDRRELVTQPDEIWNHQWADYAEREDGSAYRSVPL